MLATMDKKGSTINIDLRSPALNWTDGEWVDSAQHTESINPATGEVIGTYADGGREEAVLAINAAARAFQELDRKDNRSSNLSARWSARLSLV